MNKVKILLLFLFCSIGYINAQDIKELGVTLNRNSNGYSLEYRLPEYKLSSKKVKNNKGGEEEFSYVDISNYGIVLEEGKPQLPQISFFLAVPYGAEEVSYTIRERKVKNEFIKKEIFPSQKTTENANEFIKDRKVYSKKVRLYNSFISISEPFVMSGVKGVQVTLLPFNYVPGKGKLLVTQHADLNIDFSGDIETKVAETETLNELLSKTFVNYDDCVNSVTKHSLKSSTSLLNTKGNYLMLVPYKYDNVAFKYFLHKRSQGYNVTYINYLGYGSGMAWVTPNEIKALIQSAYNNTAVRPEYVLLIGNADDVPAWQYEADGETYYSDLGFTQLDGSDVFADVSFGRWPVDTEQELENIIAKTIKMDNSFMAEEIQPKNATVIADYDADFWYDLVYPNYQETAEKISGQLETYDFNVSKIYEYTGGTTDNVKNALNNNPYYVLYRGHGSIVGWSGPEFENAEAEKLTNDIYPVVFSIACHTGNFTRNCLGKKMLNMEHGCVAFLGGSEVTPREGNAYFSEKLFINSYLAYSTLGKLIDYAKLAFAKTIYIPPTTLERKMSLIIAYNLLGDPSLNIRASSRSEFHVTGGESNRNETVVFPVAENIDVAGVEYGEDYDVFKYTVKGGASPSDVTFKARNSISFGNGFSVESGASFLAEVNSNFVLKSGKADALEIYNAGIDKIDENDLAIENEETVQICFPNPFDDVLNLKLQLKEDATVKFLVFDHQGVFIEELLNTQSMPKDTYAWQFNTKSFSPGMYFYKLNVGDKMYWGKLLKK